MTTRTSLGRPSEHQDRGGVPNGTVPGHVVPSGPAEMALRPREIPGIWKRPRLGAWHGGRWRRGLRVGLWECLSRGSGCRKSHTAGAGDLHRGLSLHHPSPADPVPVKWVFRHLWQLASGRSSLGPVQWVGLRSLQARGGSSYSNLETPCTALQPTFWGVGRGPQPSGRLEQSPGRSGN